MRSTATVCLLALLLATGSLQAQQQIYKWTDKEGHVHYGSTPPPSEAESSTEKVRIDPPPSEAQREAAMQRLQAMEEESERLKQKPEPEQKPGSKPPPKDKMEDRPPKPPWAWGQKLPGQQFLPKRSGGGPGSEGG